MKKRLKRWMSVALSAMMVLSVVFVNTGVANAESEVVYEDGKYNVSIDFRMERYETTFGDMASVTVVDGKIVSAEFTNAGSMADYITNIYYKDVNGESDEVYTGDVADYTDADVSSQRESGCPGTVLVPLKEGQDSVRLGLYISAMSRAVFGNMYLALDEVPAADTSGDGGDDGNAGGIDDKYKPAAGSYTIDAEFWHAANEAVSGSANACLLSGETKIKVAEDGTAKVYVALTSTSMDWQGSEYIINFFDFEYQDLDGTFKAAKHIGGTDRAPEKVSFTLPENTDFTMMEATYNNPVMGDHTVNIRLKLDWDSIAATDDIAYDDDDTTIVDGGDKDNDDDGNKDNNGDTNEETVLDKDNLKDGVYEVKLALWNATSDKASMGAAGLLGATTDDPWSTARIVVEDGEYTMYLYTQLMAFGTIEARLQYMKVKNAAGTYVDASTIGTAGSNPTAFYFTMPSTEEFTDVKINPMVAMMNNADIDARTKVNWSTLKAAGNDTDPTVPPQEENVPKKTDTTTTTTNNNSSSNVKTGDNTQVIWFAAAMILSLMAVAYVNRKHFFRKGVQ